MTPLPALHNCCTVCWGRPAGPELWQAGFILNAWLFMPGCTKATSSSYASCPAAGQSQLPACPPTPLLPALVPSPHSKQHDMTYWLSHVMSHMHESWHLSYASPFLDGRSTSTWSQTPALSSPRRMTKYCPGLARR